MRGRGYVCHVQTTIDADCFPTKVEVTTNSTGNATTATVYLGVASVCYNRKQVIVDTTKTTSSASEHRCQGMIMTSGGQTTATNTHPWKTRIR